MTKIILCGCNGKMGQVISEIVRNDSDVQIVAGVDLNTEAKSGYPVFAQITECDREADVIIDFSNPSVLLEMLQYSIK